MIGFFDWTEGRLSLFIFEKKGNNYLLKDTKSIAIKGELNQSLLTPFTKFNLEHIYLSIPINRLTLRELTFPFSDERKIKETISYELEGFLLGSVNDYSINYIIKDSSDNTTSVLAACMEKTRLKEIIDIFFSVGLEPVAITSLDLKPLSKNINILLDGPETEEKRRSEAAKEELINPSINLRQGELAYKGHLERIKKSLRFTMTLLLLLLLILVFDITIRFISVKKENSNLHKEINTIYQNTFPQDTKIIDPLRQFKGNLYSLKEKKTILSGVPVLDILLNISNLKIKDITINEFNLDGEKIIIKGSTSSFEDVDEFKNTLQSSFAEVRVIDSKSTPDKKISFTIIMKEKMS
jgi:type II secretory pathway component PulL